MTVFSRDLGRALGLGDAQARKDLAAFGLFGQPGVSYDTQALIAKLKTIRGTDRTWPVILVRVISVDLAAQLEQLAFEVNVASYQAR